MQNFDFGGQEKIMVYKTVDKRDIELIFLPPKKKVYDKSPVYFMISGGGWHTESKIGMYHYSMISAEALRNNGWSVVSIDYRCVTRDMTVKDDISVIDITVDVIDSLQYIAENAETLDINAQKIVVTGHSAGAHLCSLVSFADPKLFKGDHFIAKYKIIGNVPISPITLLYTDGVCDRPMEFDHLFAFPKKEYDDKIAHLLSPYDYITADSVPSLFVHGTHDNLVSCQNSVFAYEKGMREGAKFELLTPINGGHSLECMVEGKTTYPSVSFYQHSIVSWINSVLDI